MQRLSVIKAVQDYRASRLVDLIELRLYAYTLPRMIFVITESARPDLLYLPIPLQNFLQPFTFITDESGKSFQGQTFTESVG